MYPNDLIPGTGFDLYNLFLGLGLVVCFLFLWFSLKKTGFNFDAVSAIFITGLFAVSIGIFSAMLFQSIYDFIADPSGGFRLTGKMTYLGGVIGGAASYLIIYNLYMHVIAPRTKIKWLQNNANAGLCDALPVIPTCIVLATAIGRIGCFFAGCCAGNPTDGSWGLACSQTYEGVKVVPVQLFESAFLFVLAAVMIVLYFRYRFHLNFSVYLIAYGIWRFCIEFARGDERGGFIPGLTPSQFWCIIMVLLGIGYIFLYRYVLKNKMKLSAARKNAQETPTQETADVSEHND